MVSRNKVVECKISKGLSRYIGNDYSAKYQWSLGRSGLHELVEVDKEVPNHRMIPAYGLEELSHLVYDTLPQCIDHNGYWKIDSKAETIKGSAATEEIFDKKYRFPLKTISRYLYSCLKGNYMVFQGGKIMYNPLLLPKHD